jgi:radical SAM superfamily enzyme YgiQ (UPF0313 family)
VRVLFIYHNIGTKNIRHFPYGVGVLSAQLKERGHETQLMYLQDQISEQDLIKRISESGPGLVAFSTVTHQWRYTVECSRIIKKVFDVPIICGGPHPTYLPEEVIQEKSINMLCIGEGENALLEVADRLENGGDLSIIPNIWVKNEVGTIFRNGIRDLIPDLDALEFPDREILPYQEIIDESKSEPIFISSRGCPYDCTFCSNSAIKSLYRGKGSYVRQRTPESIIEEINRLRERYQFSSLNFYDEAFGFNRKWLRRFCDLYATEIGYPFGAFIRAETMDREMFHCLRKAGLTLIYIGVESGNESIRRHTMNRQVGNEQIIQTCKDARAEGIQVWTFNMVGVPGETVETIRETMALNRIINPHFASVSIYQPFPGTRMYDVCKANGYITKGYSTSLYDDSVLELPTITREQLLKGYKEFTSLAQDMRMNHEKKGDKIFLVDL